MGSSGINARAHGRQEEKVDGGAPKTRQAESPESRGGEKEPRQKEEKRARRRRTTEETAPNTRNGRTTARASGRIRKETCRRHPKRGPTTREDTGPGRRGRQRGIYGH